MKFKYVINVNDGNFVGVTRTLLENGIQFSTVKLDEIKPAEPKPQFSDEDYIPQEPFKPSTLEALGRVVGIGKTTFTSRPLEREDQNTPVEQTWLGRTILDLFKGSMLLHYSEIERAVIQAGYSYSSTYGVMTKLIEAGHLAKVKRGVYKRVDA